MPRDSSDLLNDIRIAADLVAQFTSGRGLPDYSADGMLRSAVERQFIIVGEALSQLQRLDAAIAASITDGAQVIAFRNILVHGYSTIDDHIVWAVIQDHLPILRREVETLLLPRQSP